jgi:hypothetical protein
MDTPTAARAGGVAATPSTAHASGKKGGQGVVLCAHCHEAHHHRQKCQAKLEAAAAAVAGGSPADSTAHRLFAAADEGQGAVVPLGARTLAVMPRGGSPLRRRQQR